MKFIFTEYYFILIFFVISFILAILIFFLSYLLVFQKADHEKLSAYECGFNPFEDARMTFDIRFYLVAILFLIFDLEISYLFPWIISLKVITFFGFWTMIFFLIILTIGFLYEWFKGALEWE
uniref:NADH dehydrogenase subunit 3 n=1 Tax=Dipterosiphonia australica TaxID=2007208 RepID=UPI0022FD5105|nr:NADH dehydrogenase subunit 3 [Dipterosiphonia australica]WAX04237.1 NADH dehydrogenase subunit 3 [Dipterosiphonia australica]